MPGGKVIYALVDKRSKYMLHHNNGRPAVYSTRSGAIRHINDWPDHRLVTVIELEVANDFKFYKKGV